MIYVTNTKPCGYTSWVPLVANVSLTWTPVSLTRVFSWAGFVAGPDGLWYIQLCTDGSQLGVGFSSFWLTYKHRDQTKILQGWGLLLSITVSTKELLALAAAHHLSCIWLPPSDRLILDKTHPDVWQLSYLCKELQMHCIVRQKKSWTMVSKRCSWLEYSIN